MKWTPDRIRKLMTMKGLTQRQLAIQLGTTEWTVSRWLNKAYRPSKLAQQALEALERVS